MHEPLSAQQRPPQFDFIYRANNNQQAKAEADIAKMAGKVDQLLARRRQLEAEQSRLDAARKRLADLKAPLMGAVVTGATLPERLYAYPGRRDPVREEELIEKAGDDLVGVV